MKSYIVQERMSCNFEILNNIQQRFCLPEIGLIWGNGFWGNKAVSDCSCNNTRGSMKPSDASRQRLVLL